MDYPKQEYKYLHYLQKEWADPDGNNGFLIEHCSTGASFDAAAVLIVPSSWIDFRKRRAVNLETIWKEDKEGTTATVP